nr:MAG TPA: hypothetical protein [Caudoviricetes sp.]
MVLSLLSVTYHSNRLTLLKTMEVVNGRFKA